MTLPATTRRAGPFTGNGVTTAFPFTFKVFAKADISVVKTSSTGIESTLVLDSDYSVTLNADQEVSPGGTITYPVSGTPLSALEKLTAVGALTYEQPTDLPTGGNYSATTVENAFDRNVMLIQQLLERFARTLVYPVGDAASGTLPTLASRASKFLAFDAGGVPIGSAGVTALPVSTFMGTVLDDVDAATARTTLGAASDSFLQAGTGAVARTVQTKLRDVVHVLDFGADPTGAVSASTAFNDAMASLGAAGGVVDIGSGKYLLSTTINVPSNVTLRGRWLNPDLIGTSAIPAYQNAGSSLRLNSAATINLAVSAGIEQLLIYRSGMTFPIADTTAYAGTAITATGSNVSLRNLLVMGFNKLFYSSGHQRHFIDRVHGDNINGLEIAGSPDIEIGRAHV